VDAPRRLCGSEIAPKQGSNYRAQSRQFRLAFRSQIRAASWPWSYFGTSCGAFPPYNSIILWGGCSVLPVSTKPQAPRTLDCATLRQFGSNKFAISALRCKDPTHLLSAGSDSQSIDSSYPRQIPAASFLSPNRKRLAQTTRLADLAHRAPGVSGGG
jgi:hypothetical protein